MEPTEVIDELEQAVQAVQAGALAFENTCAETEDVVIALKDNYLEKADSLLNQVTDMESDKTGLVVEIVENGIQTTEEVEQTVANIGNEYLDELEQKVNVGLSNLLERFTEAKEQTSNFIDETSQSIERITGDYDNVDSSYRDSLNESLAKLADIENEVSEELRAFSDTLESQLSVDHMDALSTYQAFVQTTVQSDLAGEFMNFTGNFDSFASNLTSDFEGMSDDLSGKFEQLTNEIVDYTESKASQEVQDIINGLIDHIVGELASIVSESIVKSSVGVSVTGATSPFLPILVGFNMIFNALEFAIELWKDFKRGLGF